MKIKLFLATFILTLSIGALYSQTWIRSYTWEDLCPGPYTHADAEVWNVIPAIGGGYLLQGHVEFIYGDIPAYESNVFWKIDENGEVVWRRTGSPHDGFVSIVSNGIDRYYCLVGGQLSVYDSEMNYLDYYLFTPINGYSVTLNDMLYDNDGLVFAGMSNNGQSIILKTDFQFNVMWQSVPVSNSYSSGYYKIIKNSNQTFTAVNYNLIGAYSASGDTLWSIRTNLTDNRYFCITNHSNGMIYVLNWSYSSDSWTIDAYNSSGECTQSTNTNLMNITAFGSRNMLETSDHNILLLMASSNVLNKITPSGNLIWSRSYPIANMGLNSNTGYGTKNMLIDSLGYIVFCGGGTLGSMTLIRADSSGIVTANNDEYSPSCILSVSHYPNPVTSSSITIKVATDKLIINPRIEIFNLKGQKVYTKQYTGHYRNKEYMINLSEINNCNTPSGIYFYKFISDYLMSKPQKLVIIK